MLISSFLFHILFWIDPSPFSLSSELFFLTKIWKVRFGKAVGGREVRCIFSALWAKLGWYNLRSYQFCEDKGGFFSYLYSCVYYFLAFSLCIISHKSVRLNFSYSWFLTYCSVTFPIFIYPNLFSYLPHQGIYFVFSSLPPQKPLVFWCMWSLSFCLWVSVGVDAQQWDLRTDDDHFNHFLRFQMEF